MNKTVRKCAIYVRVSTESQELDQQLDSCIKFCELKGYDRKNIEVFREVQTIYNVVDINILPIVWYCLSGAQE